MSFGRLRNKTIPTNVDEDQQIDLLEVKNLKNMATKTLDTVGGFIKSLPGEVVDFHKGAFHGIEAGIQTGKRTFEVFWGEVARDLDKITPTNKNVISEFHFNLAKKGLTDEQKAYYKQLQLTDEQLQGSYDDYVKRATQEAEIRREEFRNGINDFIISKKEELVASDDRGQELMQKYGISAMLGYGFGQMLGNYNEMATNIVATYFGAKFATGTNILGLDDAMNVFENVLSNSISERTIAEARGDDFDFGDVATRTVVTSLFMKGLGSLFKKGFDGRATRLEQKKLRKMEAIIAQDLVSAKTIEDAVERGLDVDMKANGIRVELGEKANRFTEEVGADKYKAYTMKKTAEEFAYDEELGQGLTAQNRQMLTKSRKKAEAELRGLLKEKYGDEYSFEQYIADMDAGYRDAKVSQVELEQGMQMPEYKVMDNEGVERNIKEAQFLEEQDISMLNEAQRDFDAIKEVMGKDDAEIRGWFDNNC